MNYTEVDFSYVRSEFNRITHSKQNIYTVSREQHNNYITNDNDSFLIASNL